MTFKVASILPVWILVIVGAILVGLISPADDYYTWLPIVLAGSLILTFAIQLAVPRKDGLVTRIMTSAVGSVLILAVTTAILALRGA